GALADKLALGDRLTASGDHRGALFAYQDAVYLDPRNAAARVKLGRAYAALRYRDQAMQQYAQALAIDPDSAEAKRAMEEAKSTPAPPSAAPQAPRTAAAKDLRQAPAEVAAAPVAPAPAAAAPAPVTAASLPRVYRLPEAQPTQGPVQAPGAVGPESEPAAVARPQDAPPAQPAGAGPTARERYKAAVALMASREYTKAIAELDAAIAQDPNLGVAYAARASARFGLGKYRESAEDYRAALGLAPQLGTPLYGLGECHRILGEPAAAADYYAQYAQSTAPDVREDLRELARKRAAELGR
ncbi:MAG TPA: tetratricopeptide repeat protein, partial [Anaeromyxobacteraceae bacterium]|nr:tetratricopeptide repeat protein [Anaeromyxobacteraceae bacterium]